MRMQFQQGFLCCSAEKQLDVQDCRVGTYTLAFASPSPPVVKPVTPQGDDAVVIQAYSPRESAAQEGNALQQKGSPNANQIDQQESEKTLTFSDDGSEVVAVARDVSSDKLARVCSTSSLDPTALAELNACPPVQQIGCIERLFTLRSRIRTQRLLALLMVSLCGLFLFIWVKWAALEEQEKMKNCCTCAHDSKIKSMDAKRLCKWMKTKEDEEFVKIFPYFFSLTPFIVAPFAMWLMVKASSASLFLIALFGMTAWLSLFSWFEEVLLQLGWCRIYDWLGFAMRRIILNLLKGWNPILISCQVMALESAACLHMHSGRLKVFCLAFCILLSWCVLFASYIREPDLEVTWNIIICFWTPMWLLIVIYSWIVIFSLRAFFKLHRLLRKSLKFKKAAQAEGEETHDMKDLQMALSIVREHEFASALTFATSMIATVAFHWQYGIWPFEFTYFGPIEWMVYQGVPTRMLDILGKLVAAMLFSGVLSGSVTANAVKQQDTVHRQERKANALKKYEGCKDKRWQAKVEDLASRGMSLRALLYFYQNLGDKFMEHFDPHVHTTSDVVRRAVIPASAEGQHCLAKILMNGVPTRPRKMVTHCWDNVFTDLVAAIVADALEEEEFAHISECLVMEFDELLRNCEERGVLDMTYWVCAFSIDQHSSICSANRRMRTDPVTGEVHPVCDCGKAKFFNTDGTLRDDGRSIDCELNKFDDMMAYLGATDSKVGQVIAVDSKFVLFTRAWCIAEIAQAFEMGMKQRLKLHSATLLNLHEETLKNVRIENMKASRPEDIDEILSRIEDKDTFNRNFQKLIFNSIISNWQGFDMQAKMKKLGDIARKTSVERPSMSKQACVQGKSTNSSLFQQATVQVINTGLQVSSSVRHVSSKAQAS